MGLSPDSTQNRRLVAVFGLLIALIAAGSLLLWLSRPDPVRISVYPPPPTPTPLPTPTPSPVTVYVSGAVATPGVLTLPAQSRVEDAIAAAGGILPDADLDRVNLAAILRDGDQVYVPAHGEAETSLATPSGGVRIRINEANIEELTTLPQIGPALAERIVAYREANGPFRTLEDLDSVEGVGPDVIEAIAELISFD